MRKSWERRWPAVHALWAASLLTGSLLSAGCGRNLWDQVSSREFSVTAWFKEEDPYEVLKNSSDGDHRAAALAKLREPKQIGGTDQQQDFTLKLLTTAASEEPHPWCRLKAIEALSTFKDPRAADALYNAYLMAGDRAKGFPPETATVIRCQALTGLGKLGQKTAVDLLVRVVQAPPTDSGTDEQSRQFYLDERIAAARALGKAGNEQATAALVQILKTEKDVALRDQAHESLQLATGRKLPPDAAAWEPLLRQPDAGAGVIADQKKPDAPRTILQTSGGDKAAPR